MATTPLGVAEGEASKANEVSVGRTPPLLSVSAPSINFFLTIERKVIIV